MSRDRRYNALINSKRWKETRARILNKQPLCSECHRQGRVRLARFVHHIVEAESAKSDEDFEELFFRETNLEGLCFDCHKELHNERGYHTAKMHQQRQTEKVGRWLERYGLGDGVALPEFTFDNKKEE